MTWGKDLLELGREIEKQKEDVEKWLVNGRAFIQKVNDELQHPQSDETMVRVVRAYRRNMCLDIALHLRETGDTAGALKIMQELTNAPLPDTLTANFYLAAFHAAVNEFEAAAQNREAFLVALDGLAPWIPVGQMQQRSTTITEDFARAVEHEKQKINASNELATAHFCHAVSLGKARAAEPEVKDEFQTAFDLAPDHAAMMAVGDSVYMAINNLPPLYSSSHNLAPDKEYCSLTSEGIGDQRSAYLDFYGRDQQKRREYITDVKATQVQLRKDGWRQYSSSSSGSDQSAAAYYIRPKSQMS